MKKFYIPIFTATLLFTWFLSQAQGTYISIASNPGNFTFDDPRFWVGGVPPPNPCNSCTIKILSNVTMVQCCGFSTAVNPVASSVFTNQTPTGAVGTDAAVTLGMRFKSSVAGSINGAKFYKL